MFSGIMEVIMFSGTMEGICRVIIIRINFVGEGHVAVPLNADVQTAVATCAYLTFLELMHMGGFECII